MEFKCRAVLTAKRIERFVISAGTFYRFSGLLPESESESMRVSSR